MKFDAKKILRAAVAQIGPASKWEGRCYEIASALVSRGLVDGVPIYGHWTGPIAKGTLFDRRTSVTQHGWILVADKRVVDPTRWVFEGAKPYIYIGENDHYDEGGTRFRRVMQGRPPPFDLGVGHPVTFSTKDMPSPAWAFVENLFDGQFPVDDPEYEIGTLSGRQLMWLANCAPEDLGGHAKAIYAALVKHGLGGLIPIDNRRKVEQGRG